MSVQTMAKTCIAFVLKIMILGLMVGSAMTELITENQRSHQKVHSRRLMKDSTPLSVFNSAPICGELGPVCPEGVYIECVVGGIVGCICSLVRTCQPTVSGCTLVNGALVTPCGF